MPLSPRIYNRDDLSHMEYDSLIRVIYTSHSSRISLLPRTKYRQAQHCPLCGAFVLRAPPAPVQCLRVHNKVFDEGSSRVFVPGGPE